MVTLLYMLFNVSVYYFVLEEFVSGSLCSARFVIIFFHFLPLQVDTQFLKRFGCVAVFYKRILGFLPFFFVYNIVFLSLSLFI